MDKRELDVIEDEENETLKLTTTTTKTANFTNRFIYKNVIIITLSALTTFTGFSALQNLQSSLYPEIGYLTLCVLYGSFVVSLFFLPNVVTYSFGYKYPLVVSMFGYTTFALAQFYPKLWVMMIVAIISGCSSGVFWASVSSNITLLAIIYARQNKVMIGPINQKFFAIFYAGFRFAQISGNLISSLTLSQDASTTITLQGNATMASLKCGAAFCPGINDHPLRLPQNTNTTTITTGSTLQNHPSPETIRNLILIYMSIAAAGILMVLLFLANLKKHEEGSKNKKDFNNIKKQLKSVSLLFLERPIQQLSILSIYIGAMGGFIYGDLTKAFIGCVLGIHNVGYGMICFGASSFVSSLITQSIVRKVGLYTMSSIGFIVGFLVLIWLLIWDVTGMPKYVVFVTICVIGISEVIVMSQTHGFYGVMYPHNKEAAFSIFKLVQSFGNTLSFSYGNHLCIRTKIIILITLHLVGVCLYSRVYYKHRKILKLRSADDNSEEEEAREDKIPLK